MSKYKIHVTRGARKALSNPSHTLFSPDRQKYQAELPQAPRANRQSLEQKLNNLQEDRDRLESEIFKMANSFEKKPVILRLANERLQEMQYEIAELTSSQGKSLISRLDLPF